MKISITQINAGTYVMANECEAPTSLGHVVELEPGKFQILTYIERHDKTLIEFDKPKSKIGLVRYLNKFKYGIVQI